MTFRINMLNSIHVSFLSPNTNTGPLRNHSKQTQLKENQKSQQKSIYPKRRQKSQQKSIHSKKRKTPPKVSSTKRRKQLRKNKVKVQLAELELKNPKDNLYPAERETLKALRRDTNINLKKADKGAPTVVLNNEDKIKEGQTQLDNREHYRPLVNPLVEETNLRVQQLISRLNLGNHIDEMTKTWLCQKPQLPHIPIFYTLPKIHKPTPVGRPIISGCDGPTERLSSFVDELLQPIAQQQKSYLKDTTHFINFLEKTKVPENTILVSMDVMSLYTNIPQEEGINIKNEPPIPTRLLQRALKLILTENSFQFNGKNYVQIHETAMTVAFVKSFMAKVTREEITQFIEQVNKHHQTIKFTAEVSETETNFLDPTVYKGERFRNESVLDVCTHFKPTETFQYTHFSTCHPSGVKRGFIKGEAPRLLSTNSSKTLFEESVTNFKTHLLETERIPRKLYSNNPLRSYF